MKPTEPRRKNRNTTGPASNGSSPGHVVRKRKSPSPAPAAAVSDLNNPEGPLPEFACKVCGRLVHVCLHLYSVTPVLRNVGIKCFLIMQANLDNLSLG